MKSARSTQNVQLLLAMFALSSVALISAQKQKLILYENADFSGRTLVVDGSVQVDPYCESIAVCSGDASFDNAMSSAALTGVWLFYNEVDYGNSGPGVEAHWGDDVRFALNTVNDRLSSFKYVGSFDDWSKDSLTLYPGQFFRGTDEEFFSAGNTEVLLATQRSVIVTGKTAWSLYSEPDYNGDAICVQPDNDQGWPGYVTDLQEVGMTVVGSVHPGCSGKTREVVMNMIRPREALHD